MKKVLLACVTFFVTQIALAQTNNIKKEKFHFNRDQDTSAGYAQAVKVDNMLYISGTVATGDMATGLKRIYSTLERTLQHYGATFQNVVKENLYTTDIEGVKQNNTVRKAFYKGDFPAATWVQIARLYMPDANIEVELVAVLPKQ